MSKILVIQTESNELIGFVMFASEKPVFSEMGWEGHCIFTGMPKDSSVFENDLTKYLQSKKNIEFNAKVDSTIEGYSLNIKRLLTAKLTRDLIGSWSPIDSDSIGCCLVPNSS